MRGRKPKPAEIKRLTGNPGKRSTDRPSPRIKAGIPECPKHLDDEARKEWRRISVLLLQAGLLTGVDRAALAAYCQWYSRWAEAEAVMKAHGVLVKGLGGFPVQNPAMKIADRAMGQMLRFLVEFGMTPSSRSRVTVTNPDQGDLIEEYLFGERESEPPSLPTNHGETVH